MDQKDKCPVAGCGREAKVIHYICEQIPMPASMPNSDLQRKPPFGVVGRDFVVKCPVHGEKVVQVEGHHITHIPKKSNKKKR